ncbi:Phosphate-selective porin O and P [Candidatus Methylobacter favarea]|uniref:Phosphate-selective porin O and P n=1 Tax=Candidatus Methylobacter favarea TaxID=2707345 RepID=A0A8S0XRK2_9GAMM|nr:porin [Candidatus Methylobacter favarea]CAA9890059.1 Phosphate-selective porin O and P [Candidatus Methylobacter favarea]
MKRTKVLVLSAAINSLLGVNSLQPVEAATELDKDAKINALERRILLLEKRLSASESNPAPVDETLHHLDQQVKILQRQGEIDREDTAEAAKKSPTYDVSRNGFKFESADKDFSLQLRGLIQADSRFFQDDKSDATPVTDDTFELRRARLLLLGKLYKNFDYFFQTEFGGGNAQLLDAMISYRLMPELAIRGGRFLVPFGLEHFNGAPFLTFVERSLVENLVPDRDNGIQFYGDISSGLVEYEVGVGNGVKDCCGDAANLDPSDDKEFFGRVFLAPFNRTEVEGLRDLRIGIAATSGDQSGSLASQKFRSAGRQVFFNYDGTVVANGDRYRIAPQLYYSWDSFGLLGEYVLTSQEVKNGAGQAARIDNSAWQIAASYVLTGELHNYLSNYPTWQNGVSVKPYNDFNPFKGKWGAFEVAARYNELNVEDVVFAGFASLDNSARKASSWEVGLNWYLNKHIKAQVDYSQTSFDGGTILRGDRDTESLVQSRLQLFF